MNPYIFIIAVIVQALRQEADGKALVLLDEVGTGTEPVEGAALGIALLKALAQSGLGSAALTIGTTHHRYDRCAPTATSPCQSQTLGFILSSGSHRLTA